MLFLQGLRERNLQFLVKNIINSVDSVLDIGCGVGDYLEKYTNSSQRVVAVEPYLPYLEEAKRKAPWAEFKSMDALTYFGQTDEKFECVLLIDVVEHLEKNEAIQMVQEAIKHCDKIVFCQTPFGKHEQDYDPWDMGGDYWQSHKSTWDGSNLHELGFNFYTVWKDWYEWDESQGNKSRDVTIAMWLSDFSEDKFTILFNVPKQPLLLDLQKTLEGVPNQTYPKFEAVIVRDSPSEEVANLMEKYQAIDSRVRVVTFDNSTDMADLEHRVSKTESGFVVTLECGEELPANKLERQIKCFKRINAAHAGDLSKVKLLSDDSYIEALRKDNFEKWKQAYLEGYNGGMGNHRSHFYNKYIEEIGFYREVSSAKKVVEFAPGNGEFFEGFVAAAPQKVFFLIDISESNLESLKSKFRMFNNVTYILNDRREIPIAEVDCVFSFLLSQSMPQSLWVEHLTEVYRMLLNGGSYVFQFAYHPDGVANDSIADSIGGSQKYLPEQMLSLVKRAGFGHVELTEPINLECYNTDIIWYLCKAIK
ncbi:MAG: methyltransferase domain-containing protein [Planctomycetota bacterium]|jgi:ubiquinone/menaquinone biosynthesis C-methylase UbiE